LSYREHGYFPFSIPGGMTFWAGLLGFRQR
jgi:hypothetical protein